MKHAVWTLAVAIVVVIGAGLAVIYTGIYNVGASGGESQFTRWLLGTTREYSIRNHASGIEPPNLGDPALVKLGYKHYSEMCVSCHGSPAGGQNETGIGLNPPPPVLSDAARRWSSNELYWIAKNGIKMTGMPAFGPTHDEHEIWAIVAFLQKLPGMTRDQYHAYGEQTNGASSRC